MDARRAAYLEALGVDVYVRRGLARPAADAPPPAVLEAPAADTAPAPVPKRKAPAASPPEMLFGLFGLYALSGPLLWAWHRLTRGRRGPPAVGDTH